jgi:hypothetical protein
MTGLRLFLPLVLAGAVGGAATTVVGDLVVAGSVGIGTTVPRGQLEATGDVRLASAHVPDRSIGLSVGRMNRPIADGWSRLAAFSEQADFLEPGEGLYGLWGSVENRSRGARFATGAHVNAFGAADTGHVEALAAVAEVAAPVTVDQLRGLYAEAKSSHEAGSAQVGTARAAWLRNDYAAGTDIDELQGAFVELARLGSGSTAQRYAGIYVDSTSPDGHIATGYGLYLTDVAPADTAFGVYQAGTDDANYFAGRVGIGREAPAYLLDVAGPARAGGFITAVTAPPAGAARPLTGTLEALAAVGTYRDSRLGRPDADARELAEAFPELVTAQTGAGGDGAAGVDYGRLTVVLLAALQELRREKDGQIRALAGRTADQATRIAALEARLAALEAVHLPAR